MPLKVWRSLRVALAGCAAVLLTAASAGAVSIELKDEASDRIERQRTAAMGRLPLPGTPDIAKFAERLEAKGLKPGQPVYLRIFKAQSELEVWFEKDGTFQLFDTYPICHWSGTLGPKTHEGDKQTPEGFYTVTSRQLHRLGRWRQALNLGFPNAYDESLKRNGSYILVHGGCSSVGCFAMTNPVIEEIYTLTAAALRAGQRYVPVHVFPFRMSEATLAKHQDSEWHPFWSELKAGFDSFERTKRPPQVSVCNGRYQVQDATSSPLEAGAPGPLAVCGPTAAELLTSDKSAWFVPIQTSASQPVPDQAQQPMAWPVVFQAAQPSSQTLQPDQPIQQASRPQEQVPHLTGPMTNLEPPPVVVQPPSKLPIEEAITLEALRSPAPPLSPVQVTATAEPGSMKGVTSIDPALAYEYIPRLVAPQPRPGLPLTGVREQRLPCSLSLPSCRRFAALRAVNYSAKSRTLARAQNKNNRSASSR